MNSVAAADIPRECPWHRRVGSSAGAVAARQPASTSPRAKHRRNMKFETTLDMDHSTSAVEHASQPSVGTATALALPLAVPETPPAAPAVPALSALVTTSLEPPANFGGESYSVSDFGIHATTGTGTSILVPVDIYARRGTAACE